MNRDSQAIKTPFGVSVFGSAILRVTPDVASINVAVFRVEAEARDAFEASRDTTTSVLKFLSDSGVTDVGTSRITLSQEYKRTNGERIFIGYGAKVGFHIITSDLDRVEEILMGTIDSGANVVESVIFQTSELKEFRAEAREHAVIAAREKATLYCDALGVSLAEVLHIEDVSPDSLTGRNEGHLHQQTDPDYTGEMQAFDPGAISIGGAVRIAFSISTIEFRQLSLDVTQKKV